MSDCVCGLHLEEKQIIPDPIRELARKLVEMMCDCTVLQAMYEAVEEYERPDSTKTVTAYESIKILHAEAVKRGLDTVGEAFTCEHKREVAFEESEPR